MKRASAILILFAGLLVLATSVQAQLLGQYFNLPGSHPDVETPIIGVVPGLVQNTLPISLTALGHVYIHQFDWWNMQYHSFTRIDNSLMFGNWWFPVNDGLPGDPQHFAVHWSGLITAANDALYDFFMQSDDDSWLFIDSNLIVDLGGIHGMAASSMFDVYLGAGTHTIDIYFAERHVVDSGFNFEFRSDDIFVKPIPEPSSLALMGCALAGLVTVLRARKRR